VIFALLADNIYQTLVGIDDPEERKRRIIAAAERQSQAAPPPSWTKDSARITADGLDAEGEMAQQRAPGGSGMSPTCTAAAATSKGRGAANLLIVACDTP
jgi:hypothetical protein